ncbi:DNA-binding transcriptional MerR regulator [Mycobacterium sp. URHB0021]
MGWPPQKPARSIPRVLNVHICVKVKCKLEHMQIGQLAERTGVSRRLLRYYEEQGLIKPSRALNGYREYGEAHVDVVLQITGLLDAGLPTRIIEQLLPCLEQPQTIYVPDVTPEMIDTLRREQARLSERIEFLTRNRDAVADYLDKVLSVKAANNKSSVTP